MKNLILFDIDDTIINTELLKKIQPETLAEYINEDPKTLRYIRAGYLNKLDRTSDFSVDEYLELIAKKYDLYEKDLKKVFLNSTNFKKCLYKETPEVLKKLKSEKYTLGIFSQGSMEFQKHKLDANDLTDFFDENHLYVLHRKIDEKIINGLPQNTIIIDDKPSVIKSLKKFKNIIPVQITRENKKGNEIVCENHISNLRELSSLLSSLTTLDKE